MAIQKRRVVYFSDEEWEALRELAQSHEETISERLRASVAFTLQRSAPKRQPFVAPIEPMRNVPIPGDAFHQEPWSRFHPVPKPTRRK